MEKVKCMYISNNQKPIHLVKSTSIFSSLNDLYNLLNSIGWDQMTCFSKNQWNPSNKCCGQCNATVLLVQEYFGGDIIECPNPSRTKQMHYFNRINGVDIDLTSKQFSNSINYGSFNKVVNLRNKPRGYGYIYEKSEYILKLKLGL